ncbi:MULTISPECIES: hypothetical protein [unclassified Mammaliicoccus]|uniref:hypothetical protein n=1 Tax=unclassified Mammaliicoccus TaxID=2803851 RepID=UPI001EFAF6D4|nr:MULTISPECIES: hypothetical protein [unclassified Mammaliicoccus]
MNTDQVISLLKIILPILSVIISFLLGLFASNVTHKKDVNKEIYNNYYSEILKLCYGLPSPSLLNFFSFISYYHDEKLSKIIVNNFQYIPEEIIENWKKYNLTLKKYNHETLKTDIEKKIVLAKVLDYHSHLIIKKSLLRSEKLSNQLKLPQLSTQLLSEMYSTEHYEKKLPTQEVIQKYNLQKLI